MEKKRLHNEELRDPNFFPNVIRVIKSRIMRWSEACSSYWGEKGACREFMGTPERNKHVEDVNVCGRIILRWIFKKWNTRRSAWTGFIWFRIRTGGGLL